MSRRRHHVKRARPRPTFARPYREAQPLGRREVVVLVVLLLALLGVFALVVFGPYGSP